MNAWKKVQLEVEAPLRNVSWTRFVTVGLNVAPASPPPFIPTGNKVEAACTKPLASIVAVVVTTERTVAQPCSMKLTAEADATAAGPVRAMIVPVKLVGPIRKRKVDKPGDVEVVQLPFAVTNKTAPATNVLAGTDMLTTTVSVLEMAEVCARRLANTGEGPVAPVAPVAPVGPVGPVAPVGPVGPIAPPPVTPAWGV